MKRVVVTGMGALTPVGDDWATIASALKQGKSGIRAMPDWAEYKNLECRVAGAVDFTVPAHYPRKKLRTMGRVSQLAVRATELALIDAGLLDDPIISSGQCGLAYGSTTGSTDAAREYAQMLTDRDLTRVSVSNYIRMMSHTAAVNVGIFFAIRGRVYPTSSA
ncbi:MAG TPA: beta-ketoacyl synthase N-terminal-like domain-containing protein, partial [Cellvibrionaceae bacterium]